jgi:hypothetical protein
MCNILGIKGWQQSINSASQWEEFARDTYMVRYRSTDQVNANWFDNCVRHYTIQEYSNTGITGPSFIRRGEFDDKPIITVLDTGKNRRVMIDGIHRSTIITKEILDGTRQNHDVLVYEWRGSKVNMIFACDFCRFYEADRVSLSKCGI